MSRSTRDIRGRLKKTGVTEIKLTGNYSRADIERIAQRDSNTLQRYGANARIEVVLDYGNHQYRSGKFTKVGEPIIMFDPHEYDGAPIAEPDTFKWFYIYVHQAKGKAGGCDGEWNNCLYYCLHDAYPEQVTEHFGRPSRLKKFLDLDVDQKVSIKRIPELEERLNIKINVMYTTGQNKAAIKLFISYNKTVKPEPIDQKEGEWISKSTFGALMFSIQHTGGLYMYDVCKMYGAIMKSGGFMIPIKCGEFQQLTDEELTAKKSIPFGIYRATINGKHGAFKINKKDYYTHYDLIFAKELGLTFNLKTGNKANALLYDSTCRINGSILFGKYMDQVLAWIKAGVPRSKELYQRLWGALSKRNKTKQCVNMECDEEVIETSECGDLRYEGYCPDARVKNMTKPVGSFAIGIWQGEGEFKI
ncbi:hypothetical protein SAMD00019534_098230, partial [Acytostelium subglobosum LB1]|uniref:hypothetical protein n=1 Tax=Acytostelium subglobosum LB1 TaxID=1410327 RepID=UPI0006450BD4